MANLTLRQLQNRRRKAMIEWMEADNASDRAHAKIMKDAYQARIDLLVEGYLANIKRRNQVLTEACENLGIEAA